MSEDSIDAYKIKKWRSSGDSRTEYFRIDRLPSFESEITQMPDTTLNQADRYFPMPKDTEPSNPLGLSRTGIRTYSRATDQEPEVQKTSNAVITNSNPLGMAAKDIPKPPKIAKAGKIRAPNIDSQRTDVQPKTVPNVIISPPSQAPQVGIKPLIPPNGELPIITIPNAKIKTDQNRNIQIDKPQIKQATEYNTQISNNQIGTLETNKQTQINETKTTTNLDQNNHLSNGEKYENEPTQQYQMNQYTTNVPNIKSTTISTENQVTSIPRVSIPLTTIAIGLLMGVLIVSLFAGVAYLVLTNANNAASTITFTASPQGGIPPYTYQWYVGSGCNSILTGQISANLTVTASSSVSYSVQITDSETPMAVTTCTNYST